MSQHPARVLSNFLLLDVCGLTDSGSFQTGARLSIRRTHLEEQQALRAHTRTQREEPATSTTATAMTRTAS